MRILSFVFQLYNFRAQLANDFADFCLMILSSSYWRVLEYMDKFQPYLSQADWVVYKPFSGHPTEHTTQNCSVVAELF